MAIWHYFSKDSDKKAKFIFNFIAPIYEKLVGGIEKKYLSAIEVVDNQVGIKDNTVLDVGTGTGVWGNMFLKRGAKKVVGIDFAEKMVKVAKRTYPNIEFMQCNAEKMQFIPENSFDIITASFVLHGVKKPKRLKILEQMKRVGKKYVVIHDFAKKVDFYIQILEYLEQSDFKYFKDHFFDEMKEFFGNCQLFITKNKTGIYISEIIGS